MTARRARIAIATSLLVIALASVALAQRFYLPEGLGVPVRFPPLNFEDGGSRRAS